MSNKKKNILFVVCAYVFFWIALLPGIYALLLGDQELFDRMIIIVKVIGTWSPTFAFLILFKKLCPDYTIKAFYKNAFEERLNLKMMLVFASFYLLAVVGAAGALAFIKGIYILSLFDAPLQGMAFAFFHVLITGATGEESGWRGYLQPSIEKRYSVVKSSVIVGIIWAGWHIPTFLATGLIGIDLIRYCLLFTFNCICLAIIIGICYKRCRNLIIPIWIHFISNLFQAPIQGAYYDFYNWLVLFEVLLAIGYVVWYKNTIQKRVQQYESNLGR